MVTIKIPWRDLQQQPEKVLAALNAGDRVEVTRRGVPVAIMVAPDPEEVALDNLAQSGDIPTDWRERHSRFMDRVKRGPKTTLPKGSISASEALLALRDEGRS